MADYIAASGTVVAPGSNYTVSTGTDFLVWIPYGYGAGTRTSSAQTFGGVSLTEQHDESTDLSGNGDPVSALTHLVAPVLTSQTLALTWSGAPSLASGYALSFENVDQTTPIGSGTTGADSATYGAVNNPSLTYTSIAGDTILYYKYHCTNSSSTIAAPTGFTLIENVVLLTTPAYRQISFYYKKTTADETSVSVGADTSGSAAIGGIHGFVVIKAGSAPTGVNIGTVDTDNVVRIDQTGIGAVGTGYEAVQGTGTVKISPTDNIADTDAIFVTATAWAAELVTFSIPAAFSMLYGTVYLFITNDSAEVNASGKALTLNPRTGNEYLVIKEQNDLGCLKSVTGLALDSDQLEWTTLSDGGGTVLMEVSGTYLINAYAGAAPATEEIYIRLGDKSDQTWSSTTLTTITIAPPATDATGTISSDFGAFGQDVTGTATSEAATGTISSDFGAFNQDLTGTATSEAATGTISSDFGAFNQDLTGTAGTAGATGTVSSDFGAFNQDLTGTATSEAATGTISSDFGAFNQDLTGTATSEAATGTISSDFGAFNQDLTGTATSVAATGTISSDFGAFGQDVTGTVSVPPVITQPPHATVSSGSTYSYTPSLDSGTDVLWFKEYGPDELTVNPETGAMSWDTSSLPRGQGVRITLGCSNAAGEDLKTLIVHVDELGTSKLMLMNGAVDTAGGTPTTTATTIRDAATEINSGDTLVLPDGSFWASTSAQNSGENTWDEQNLNTLPTGLSNQHTSIMSEGYTLIDSADHDAIARDDKGLEAGVSNTGEYYKFSAIEWTGSNRGPILFRMTGTLFDFCGGTDGSYAVTPTTQAQAGAAFANVAGMYIGASSSAENCFGFGDARYIFQAGNFTTACSFNRCIARPDEYNGTNPRGGIVHYSVDQSGTFSSYVIDGDQEHLSPFYNNYAGAFGLPATGNETHAQSQIMRGCASINVDMNTILNDSNSGTNLLTIEDFLLLDTTNTVTPWTHATSLLGIQSDSKVAMVRFAMSETHRWDFATDTAGIFLAASTGSTIDGAIFDRLGWDGVSATIDIADLVGSEITVDSANIYDFKGAVDAPGSSTPTTTITTTNPKDNGWDYPTRAETGSPIATAGQAPDLTLFAAPSLLLPIDIGWDTATTEWAWPHPEEQHIATRMATYSKSGMAVRNPTASTDPTDLTGTITGARGFAASGESFSEYIWGQFGRTVPPLRVSATATANGEVTFRIGKYRSSRGDTITNYKVYETSDLVNPVGTSSGLKIVVNGIAAGAHTYVIKAVDATKISAYGANETGESGPSRSMAVTVSAANAATGTVSSDFGAFNQDLTGTATSEAATGTISSDFGAFGQDVTGNIPLPGVVTGTIVSSFGAFNQDLTGTATSEAATGTISSDFGAFGQDVTGTATSEAATGTISSDFGAFNQDITGNVAFAGATGTVSSSFGAFNQDLTGTVSGSAATGTISSSFGAFSQDLAQISPTAIQQRALDVVSGNITEESESVVSGNITAV